MCIIKEMSLLELKFTFIENITFNLFDVIQACPDKAILLKQI